VRGLKTKLNYPEFVNLIQQYDVFCTVETNLNQYDKVDLNGYTYFGKCRKKIISRKSGGIGLYVKNEFSSCVELLDLKCEYLLSIKIKGDILSLEKDLILCAVYLPPTGSRYLDEDELLLFENEICQICTEHKYCIFVGDINARTARIPDFVSADEFLADYFNFDDDTLSAFNRTQLLEKWGFSLSRVSSDSKTNAHGHMFIELCKNNSLFILNGRVGQDKNNGQFTYRETSVIDYAFSTPECFEFFEDFAVIETDALFSDGHNLLSLTLNTRVGVRGAGEKTTDNSSRIKWDASKQNEFIANIDCERLARAKRLCESDSPQVIDTVTEEISLIFQQSAIESFPPRAFNRTNKDKPWFGPDCRKARKGYHRAKTKYCKNKTIRNKENLKSSSKHYKRTMNRYINKYKFSKTNKLRDMHSKNPKHYWKYINSLKSKSPTNMPSLDDFYDFFKDKNKNNSQEDDFSLPENFLLNSQEMLNCPITESEVSLHISKLNNSKSPSPSDSILNEYIKNTQDIFLPLYTSLFNNVLNTGHLPKSWLEGYIIPIYKHKGTPSQPENYRPITILSCIGKLFTSILNTRINNFLEEFELLNENQAGFRKGYSTVDHIFLLHSLVEIMKQSKKKLYCAFIDFAMAFDSVWRVGLWQKLLTTSINGKFFRIIYNMYNNIKSCIFMGEKSNFFACENGLRQGENLSPVIFSIFLNDLESYIKTAGSNGVQIDTGEAANWLQLLVVLYADDTLIISDDAIDFQNMLSTFHEYCKEWKLHVNISKSKIVIFGSRNVSNLNFHIGEQSIEIVDRYKYLGVIFTSNGSFAATRKHLVEQAKKAMHILYTKIYNLELPIDLQLKLFDHTILPILTYGSEVWGYESLDAIEKVHNEFLRKITKSRKSTPLYMLYAELGRYPVSISIKSRMIGYWNRLVVGKKSKLSYQMYNIMHVNRRKSKWIASILNILSTIGRPDIFMYQSTLSDKHLNKTVKRTLIDQFKQKWFEDVQKSNKGKQYFLFKKDCNFENYLTLIPRNLSYYIFKLRTANHRFPIETGRWLNISVENRICEKCSLNCIGDEKHYLLKCPFFRNDRENLINSKYTNCYNEYGFLNLLTTNNATDLINLGKFIRILLKT